jgi:hypothetical protein
MILLDNARKAVIEGMDQTVMTGNQRTELAEELAYLDEDIKLCEDVYSCLLRYVVSTSNNNTQTNSM